MSYVQCDEPQEVTLGDGHVVEATGSGVVAPEMSITSDNLKRCKLQDVLFVPDLSFNLLSVSKTQCVSECQCVKSSTCSVCLGG